MLTLDPLCYALPLTQLPEQRDAARHLLMQVDESLALDRLSPPTPDADRMSWRATLDEIWGGEDLIFSQIDPLAFISGRVGEVAYLGTPIYRTGGDKTTPLLLANRKRAGDAGLEGARLVIPYENPTALELAMLSGLGEKRDGLGAEMRVDDLDSALRRVRYSRTDLALISDHDWAALQRLQPRLAEALHVVATGPSFPNAPFISSHTNSKTALKAISRGVTRFLTEHEHEADRAILQLEGWEQVDLQDYDKILRWKGNITPVA
ncbi:MAG: hypothetical protein Alpg2KO_09640 [Alphaproteobacteria bacterium]